MQLDDIENVGPKERSDGEPQPCWTAPTAKIYSIETTQNNMGTHYTLGDAALGCVS